MATTCSGSGREVRRPLRKRSPASATGFDLSIRREIPQDKADRSALTRARTAPSPTPFRRIVATQASIWKGSRSISLTCPMSALMSFARLRWSRTVVGCQSKLFASCQRSRRSVTVEPTVVGAVPRTVASHSATSARMDRLVPRKVFPTWWPLSPGPAGAR